MHSRSVVFCGGMCTILIPRGVHLCLALAAVVLRKPWPIMLDPQNLAKYNRCMRQCRKCGKRKSLKRGFPKNLQKVGGHGHTCLQCQREYCRTHYSNNRQYYIDKARRRVVETRDWFQ